LNDETAVWNRAAMESGGPSPREGDRALADLLLVHGLVMNGGVFHAVEVVSKEELRAACVGLRYFGFDAAAELLQTASNEEWTDESEERFNNAYAVDDEDIGKRFHEHFAGSREKYAP
jgi:hypothetical protein